MLSPQLLLERGVPVYEALQEPGQFILTFPYAFCASMDTGEGASAPQALRSSRPSMVGLLILLDCCACFVHQFCCLTPSCRAPQCRATLESYFLSSLVHAGFNCSESVCFAPADWLRFGGTCADRLRRFRQAGQICHEQLLLQVRRIVVVS